MSKDTKQTVFRTGGLHSAYDIERMEADRRRKDAEAKSAADKPKPTPSASNGGDNESK